MTILAVDYGMKRVGLALKTAEHISELPPITWNKPYELTKKLQEVLEHYEVTDIVFGIPSHGPIVHRVQELADNFSGRYNTVLANEDFTTKEAEHELSKVGMSTKKQRNIADSTAARLILEDYLEHK